jgi:uncharacterized protein YjeT (DUF2065 family)
MRTKLAWFLGLLSAVNGVFMMMAPGAWYPIFPGVVQSGPFNAHFIRDIGAAFLVAGVGFVWFANDSRARPAALAAAAFFALHALIHIGDAITGRESLYHAALDAPTVYLSALIAIWIAWPQSISSKLLKTGVSQPAPLSCLSQRERRFRKEASFYTGC